MGFVLQVAVPTSSGYGATLGGVAPLLACLSSGAPGVSVVNIDNGFGGAMAAARMLRVAKKMFTARSTSALDESKARQESPLSNGLNHSNGLNGSAQPASGNNAATNGVSSNNENLDGKLQAALAACDMNVSQGSEGSHNKNGRGR